METDMAKRNSCCRSKIIFLFTLTWITLCDGLRVEEARGSGSCPAYEILLKNEFDPFKFSGTWYVTMRYGEDTDVKCVKGNYEMQGSKMRISYKGQMATDDRVIRAEGELNPEDIRMKRKMKVNFFGNSSLVVLGASVPYHLILATDYQNYAIIWGCRIMPRFNLILQYSWVLTRKQYIGKDQGVQREIVETSRRYGLDPSEFTSMDQYDCNLNGNPTSMIKTYQNIKQGFSNILDKISTSWKSQSREVDY